MGDSGFCDGTAGSRNNDAMTVWRSDMRAVCVEAQDSDEGVAEIEGGESARFSRSKWV